MTDSLGTCGLCKSPLTLYFYPRGATSPPGSMKVCTNRECYGSVSGMARAQAEQMRQWARAHTTEGTRHANPDQRTDRPRP